MPSIPIDAPAKINLFLNILGPRPDGFHDLVSLMCPLDLADTLHVVPQDTGRTIELTCSEPSLAGVDNLVCQAYHTFYTACDLSPIAVSVHLEKRIPVQAGLGGGSSDAAAMLQVLNRLHDNHLSPEALQTLAAQLGSDVPFFLAGGPAVVSGRGEQIQPLPLLPAVPIVLLKPRHYGIAAKVAYQAMGRAHDYHPLPASVHDALLTPPHTLADLARCLQNDFERVLFPMYPDLADAKTTLQTLGLPGVLLSGSGPTLFGLLSDPDQQLPRIHDAFPASTWEVMATRLADPVYPASAGIGSVSAG